MHHGEEMALATTARRHGRKHGIKQHQPTRTELDFHGEHHWRGGSRSVANTVSMPLRE